MASYPSVPSTASYYQPTLSNMMSLMQSAEERRIAERKLEQQDSRIAISREEQLLRKQREARLAQAQAADDQLAINKFEWQQATRQYDQELKAIAAGINLVGLEQAEAKLAWQQEQSVIDNKRKDLQMQIDQETDQEKLGVLRMRMETLATQAERQFEFNVDQAKKKNAFAEKKFDAAQVENNLARKERLERLQLKNLNDAMRTTENNTAARERLELQIKATQRNLDATLAAKDKIEAGRVQLQERKLQMQAAESQAKISKMSAQTEAQDLENEAIRAAQMLKMDRAKFIGTKLTGAVSEMQKQDNPFAQFNILQEIFATAGLYNTSGTQQGAIAARENAGIIGEDNMQLVLRVQDNAVQTPVVYPGADGRTKSVPLTELATRIKYDPDLVKHFDSLNLAPAVKQEFAQLNGMLISRNGNLIADPVSVKQHQAAQAYTNRALGLGVSPEQLNAYQDRVDFVIGNKINLAEKAATLGVGLDPLAATFPVDAEAFTVASDILKAPDTDGKPVAPEIANRNNTVFSTIAGFMKSENLALSPDQIREALVGLTPEASVSEVKSAVISRSQGLANAKMVAGNLGMPEFEIGAYALDNEKLRVLNGATDQLLGTGAEATIYDKAELAYITQSITGVKRDDDITAVLDNPEMSTMDKTTQIVNIVSARVPGVLAVQASGVPVPAEAIKTLTSNPALANHVREQLLQNPQQYTNVSGAFDEALFNNAVDHWKQTATAEALLNDAGLAGQIMAQADALGEYVTQTPVVTELTQSRTEGLKAAGNAGTPDAITQIQIQQDAASGNPYQNTTVTQKSKPTTVVDPAKIVTGERDPDSTISGMLNLIAEPLKKSVNEQADGTLFFNIEPIRKVIAQMVTRKQLTAEQGDIITKAARLRGIRLTAEEANNRSAKNINGAWEIETVRKVTAQMVTRKQLTAKQGDTAVKAAIARMRGDQLTAEESKLLSVVDISGVDAKDVTPPTKVVGFEEDRSTGRQIPIEFTFKDGMYTDATGTRSYSPSQLQLKAKGQSVSTSGMVYAMKELGKSYKVPLSDDEASKLMASAEDLQSAQIIAEHVGKLYVDHVDYRLTFAGESERLAGAAMFKAAMSGGQKNYNEEVKRLAETSENRLGLADRFRAVTGDVGTVGRYAGSYDEIEKSLTLAKSDPRALAGAIRGALYLGDFEALIRSAASAKAPSSVPAAIAKLQPLFNDIGLSIAPNGFTYVTSQKDSEYVKYMSQIPWNELPNLIDKNGRIVDLIPKQKQ